MANVSQSRQREILDAFKKMLRKCLVDTVYCQQIVRGCERGVCLCSMKCSDK